MKTNFFDGHVYIEEEVLSMIFFGDLIRFPNLYYHNENQIFIGYFNHFHKHI